MASGREVLNIHHQSERDKIPGCWRVVVDSKEIFKELLDPEAVESLYDDEDEELCGTEDENCEDNEVIE